MLLSFGYGVLIIANQIVVVDIGTTQGQGVA